MAKYIAVSPIKDQNVKGGVIQPGQPVEIANPEQAKELLEMGIIEEPEKSSKSKK